MNRFAPAFFAVSAGIYLLTLAVGEIIKIVATVILILTA